ncbi:MAG: DUF2691 family protein [Sarcina sp.]
MKKVIVILNDNIDLDIRKILVDKYFSEYDWFIDNFSENTEILYEGDSYELDTEKLTVSKLEELFETEDYYIVNLMIQAYKKGKHSQYNLIKNKRDFLNFDCEILFRIFDVKICEIIIKDDKLFREVYNKLGENLELFERVEYTKVNKNDIFLNF